MRQSGISLRCRRATGSQLKINAIVARKAALLTAAFCTALFAFSHNASAVRHPLPPVVSLIFGHANDLGQVLFGIPSGDADRLAYVNHLIDMAPDTSNSFSGQTFSSLINEPRTRVSELSRCGINWSCRRYPYNHRSWPNGGRVSVSVCEVG